MYILLVYDISSKESGEKIQRKIFKTCKKYLHHIQGSVFEGNLSESQLLSLKKELQLYLKKNTDSLIIFKINNEKWIQKEIVVGDSDNMNNYL